jgi:hypothetical protein
MKPSKRVVTCGGLRVYLKRADRWEAYNVVDGYLEMFAGYVVNTDRLAALEAA